MEAGLSIALGFLKENDGYCQNQTIRAANDMWLGTTRPLPVADEPNETAGSQHRKSKQKERCKHVHKHTPPRGEEGLPWNIGVTLLPWTELTACFCHVFPAAECASVCHTHDSRDSARVYITGGGGGGETHRKMADQTANRAVENT